jgi:hypothetical protein
VTIDDFPIQDLSVFEGCAFSFIGERVYLNSCIWGRCFGYRVCGNYPTSYSKIYLDTLFTIIFGRNNHNHWCHFKTTNVSFKKTPGYRFIVVPNKSYGEKYLTIGGRRIISAHLVGLGLVLGLQSVQKLSDPL